MIALIVFGIYYLDDDSVMISGLNIEPLSCEALFNTIETEYKKIDYACTEDSDCVFKDNGGCGSCMNNDTDDQGVKNLLKIYNTGAEKNCFPQKECKTFECNSCIDNRCSEIYDEN